MYGRCAPNFHDLRVSWLPLPKKQAPLVVALGRCCKWYWCTVLVNNRGAYKATDPAENLDANNI